MLFSNEDLSKGGRPTLVPGYRVSERISAGFTIKEKMHLEKWAKYKQVPLSILIREAVAKVYGGEPGEEKE